MYLVFKKFIERSYIKANIGNSIFLFGDNMRGIGYGGQAFHMRAEPNSFGVPTKWSPFQGDAAYFKDSDYENEEVIRRINFPFDLALCWLTSGRTVVMPASGIGTGLSQLKTRAPRILELVDNRISELKSNADDILTIE